MDYREGLLKKTHFPVYILHIFPQPLSKRNDLAETLFFRGTLQREPGAGLNNVVSATRSKKTEPLADRLFPRTNLLPAVPNRRVQEISAREGC